MALVESENMAEEHAGGLRLPAEGSQEPVSTLGGPGAAQIYGSFWIDDVEFALPVRAIREVVKQPAAVTQASLAPPYLSGFFNLRGMIIPIIDLRILLDFPTRQDNAIGDLEQEEKKVAIIEDGDRCIGIMLDRAGEVINEPGAARVHFKTKHSDARAAVIDGFLKLDGGDRIVQILDPRELLRLDRVPNAEASELTASKVQSIGNRLSCVSFQVGHTCCAIDLRFVQEVREMPPVENSPFAQGYVMGTVDLRGDVFPVVDFRSYMSDEPAYPLSAEAIAQRRLLVIRTDGGLIGLMVYSIDSIIPFFESDVLPFAKLALPRGNVVKGCLEGDHGAMVLQLDYERLKAEPGLVGPAAACRDAHSAGEANPKEAADARPVERCTYIIFSINSCFAMDTSAVSEVINKPEEMLAPPYAHPFVEGIINLRGELITLINLRRLYGLEEVQSEDQKALIFTHLGRKFAILVDSVDEIVMTTTDYVNTEDASGLTDQVGSASEDISGVLHVAKDGQSKSYVLIMDVGALVTRCEAVSGEILSTA